MGALLAIALATLTPILVGGAQVITCTQGGLPQVDHTFQWINKTGAPVYVTRLCHWTGMSGQENADMWRNVTRISDNMALYGPAGLDHYLNGNAGNEAEPQWQCESFEPDSIAIAPGDGVIAHETCIYWFMTNPPLYMDQGQFIVTLFYRSTP